jgi:hypothetical protein
MACDQRRPVFLSNEPVLKFNAAMIAKVEDVLRRFVRPVGFEQSRSSLRILALQLGQVASTLPIILDDIASSKETIELIASRSFRHTNGFLKIVLHSLSPQGSKLRIHFWPTGSASAENDADPHDHRWTFLSIPLFGTLYEERYRIAATNAQPEMHELACSPRFSERIKVTSKKACRLARYGSYTRRPGGPYSCRAGIIHRLFPVDSRPTATLVLTLPPVAPTAAVFKLGTSASQTASIPARSLGVSELCTLLLQIRIRLSKAHSPDGSHSSSN